MQPGSSLEPSFIFFFRIFLFFHVILSPFTTINVVFNLNYLDVNTIVSNSHSNEYILI